MSLELQQSCKRDLRQSFMCWQLCNNASINKNVKMFVQFSTNTKVSLCKCCLRKLLSSRHAIHLCCTSAVPPTHFHRNAHSPPERRNSTHHITCELILATQRLHSTFLQLPSLFFNGALEWRSVLRGHSVTQPTTVFTQLCFPLDGHHPQSPHHPSQTHPPQLVWPQALTHRTIFKASVRGRHEKSQSLFLYCPAHR